VRRALLALVALACAAAAVTTWAAPTRAQTSQVAKGRELFLSGCSYCHGEDARGVNGRGPTLYGAGAAAADFYLSTGRMPLAAPGDEPVRNRPAYSAPDRQALVAYVGSLGGPGVPAVDPARGDLGLGERLFADGCAGCHAITGRGGVVPGAVAPPLQQATPGQIAEAVRVGPSLMPEFPDTRLDQHELDSVTKYVLQTRALPDEGGWGIGNIGPIPEGLVAWMLAGAALLIAMRLIGERNER
jgi:ubiquinol-cytochrome c reductase cytochrome c subunit